MPRSRLVPSHFKRYLTQRLVTVEKRLLTKIFAERAARERADAATDEETEKLDDRVADLDNEQTRWKHRVRWLEKHVGKPAAKPRRRTRRRKS